MIYRKYCWRRDHLDRRNRKFVRMPVPIPDKLDWTAMLPPAYDQGSLGSCVANAIADALQYLEKDHPEHLTRASRLFMYYNARDIEDSTASDNGCEIMDCVKSVNRLGVCPETEWPYDEERVTDRPYQGCYDDALKDLLLQYRSVDNTVLHDLLAALVEGPVVGGFSVFESFESDAVAATGVVPMPGLNEAMIGGHAVLLTGYDQATKLFSVRNSWGSSWGDHGNFTIPFAYFTDGDLASDFWMLQKVM